MYRVKATYVFTVRQNEVNCTSNKSTEKENAVLFEMTIYLNLCLLAAVSVNSLVDIRYSKKKGKRSGTTGQCYVTHLRNLSKIERRKKRKLNIHIYDGIRV